MNNKKETITGLSIKGEAILVYLIPLLGFIFSFLKDKVNKEARWIYNQAGAVWLSSMIISVAGLIVAIVPIVGIVFSVMLKILSVVLFVFLIIALVKAYEGEHYEIPVVCEFARVLWNNEEEKNEAKEDVIVKEEVKEEVKVETPAPKKETTKKTTAAKKPATKKTTTAKKASTTKKTPVKKTTKEEK